MLAGTRNLTRRKMHGGTTKTKAPDSYHQLIYLNLNEASEVTDFDSLAFTKFVYSDEEINYSEEVKGHYGQDYKTFMEKKDIYLEQ